MATEDETKAQFAKFVQSARNLECDQDGAKFADQVKRVAMVPKPEKGEK